MSEISVVGLGNMGAALALSLLRSGQSVTVWNRSSDKAQELVDAGATLAASLGGALDASPATITCLKNHKTTTEILRPHADALAGKAILDLSSGGAAEAEELVDMLEAAGAGWLIGMINAYPSGIGAEETSILCASPEPVWVEHGEAIRALGGASAHVGTTAAAVPALFASLFTARQGFMFGLIYGGAICRRAGLPVEAFAAQIPVTLGMAGKYGETFARTVPERAYDDPGATMAVYLHALDDVMATFEVTGTADALPRLMRDLTKRAVEDGLADKELTALVEMLAQEDGGG
jgi:3-hydroxyisobutyrate dehydrogenase-like beta-hydroxyacid dehydrogenase